MDRSVQQRGRRRRHPHAAARSRVVAAVLSVLAFLGIGSTLAARATTTTAASTAPSDAAGSIQRGSDPTGSSSFGSALPGLPTSGTTPITSSHGS